MPILDQFGRLWKYDAAESSPRRTAPRRELRNEDDVLRQEYRERLISSARDARRNFSVAAWMIRKHLDFVSDFSFQATSGNKNVDPQLQTLMERWTRRRNCHAAERHPLRRLIRLAEACRTLDGDGFFELLRSGRINYIRGDRVRNKRGQRENDEWTHGVRRNPAGKALAYAVHRRTRSGTFEFEKELPARHAIHHGYWDDTEQIRGVSPLSAALNSLRDTYEGIDYALAKAKAEMLFGYAIVRQPPDGAEGGPFDGHTPRTGDEDAADPDTPRYPAVNHGPGVWQLELDPGDDIKAVSGQTPSHQFQTFTNAIIGICLKALDLPFSFFDEAHTNFFGSRAALQLYKRSAQHKQQDNRDVLDEITFWKVREWILTGALELPRGWTIADVRWDWTPRGIPWWDRSKEIRGDLLAILAGLDTPQNVVRDHGSGTGDWFENVRKIGEALRFADKELDGLDFRLSFAAPPEPQPTGKTDDAE